MIGAELGPRQLQREEGGVPHSYKMNKEKSRPDGLTPSSAGSDLRMAQNGVTENGAGGGAPAPALPRPADVQGIAHTKVRGAAGGLPTGPRVQVRPRRRCRFVAKKPVPLSTDFYRQRVAHVLRGEDVSDSQPGDRCQNLRCAGSRRGRKAPGALSTGVLMQY